MSSVGGKMSRRGQGQGVSRRMSPLSAENSLKKLVEEYLAENKERLYFDFDDMVISIQHRSYRFARMKRHIVRGLIKQAYDSYCQSHLYSGVRDPEVVEVPSSCESNQLQNASDDDVEIEEIPHRPTMNNQIIGLYQKNPRVGDNEYMTTDNTRTPTVAATDFTNADVDLYDFRPEEVELARNKSVKASHCMDSSESNTSESLLPVDDDVQIIEPVTSAQLAPCDTPFHSSDKIETTDATTMSNVNTGSTVAAKGERVPESFPVEHKTVKLKNLADFTTKILPASPLPTKRKLKAVSSDDTQNVQVPRRKFKKEFQPEASNFSFADFGGNEKLLQEICKLLLHLKHPEMYRALGITPPRGFLLNGPPGCGKTLLAQAIAGELGVPMLKIAATELISGISGESEGNIRDVFEQALIVAPSIIFMDEIDAITPKRENAGKEMERRIVAQLISCIDDLATKPNGHQILLIGATSRIETIDSSLRRAGRFDREICLGIPNQKAREQILRVISRDLRVEETFNFEVLSLVTPGYVGADLHALVREAAVQAITAILDSKHSCDQGGLNMEVDEATVSQTEDFQKWLKQINPLSEDELAEFCVRMEDFEKALKVIQPSAKREGFATVPDTTWSDIGALKDIRDELQVSILGPVKHASAFQALGLNAPAGVLLCGPPGCGKTLLAKAVANEAGINFISVKGPELLNMYVGESERAVRQCFQRAKNSSPCVIFFDEIDSLCPRRSEGRENGSSSRIVNQLLTEMDGMESRLGVFVMGATNRPDIIDPAILRPGRLDKILFVNLPSPAERVDILRTITKDGSKPKFADDVSIEEIGAGNKCDNFTGADLAALIREAGLAAFRELVLNSEENLPEKDLKIFKRHFDEAFTKTKPSVSEKDRLKYEQMKELHSVLNL